jgi:predicted metal-dependent hydrolase
MFAARARGRPMDEEEELRLMRRGADLFNAGEFFECHEVWEDVWNAQPPSERLFLQGLIQIAVGCEHFNRGNLRGAVALLERGTKKVRKYGARHRGVRIAQLDRDASSTLADIRLVQSGQVERGRVRLPTVEFDPERFALRAP